MSIIIIFNMNSQIKLSKWSLFISAYESDNMLYLSQLLTHSFLTKIPSSEFIVLIESRLMDKVVQDHTVWKAKQGFYGHMLLHGVDHWQKAYKIVRPEKIQKSLDIYSAMPSESVFHTLQCLHNDKYHSNIFLRPDLLC